MQTEILTSTNHSNMSQTKTPIMKWYQTQKDIIITAEIRGQYTPEIKFTNNSIYVFANVCNVDIFQNKGEDYFRKIEEKITLFFLEKKNSVISVGGGAFINHNIRKKIKRNGYSFWLNWKVETILDRISKNNRRPLALKLSSKDLSNLYRKRIKFYKLSDFKVNCDNKNKKEIINNIFKLLKNENSSN